MDHKMLPYESIRKNYKHAFSTYLGGVELNRQLISIVEMIKKHDRILLIGNGGSHVGVCMHFEEDCTKLAGIPCLTLSNPGFVTCLGNDCGFENVYVEWLKCHQQKEDLIIAVSSSGESPNIVNAVKSTGKPTITLTGFEKNNRLSQLGHINLHTPFKNYGIVESLHATILHMVLDILIEQQKS